MYSLDINFLNDRKERPEAGVVRRRVVQDSPRPLYIGIGVALALLGLTGGAWGLLQNRNAALEQRKAELDSQLTALSAQLSEVDSIRQQAQEINSTNQALATVFDRIKPWSAVLQDIRDRVPSGVQLDLIEQVEAPPTEPAAAPSPPAEGEAAPPPAAPEPPPPRVQISGQARSFNDVNDFVLTLQRSPFLKSEEVRLVRAELIDNPTQIEFADENSENRGEIEVQLPQVVQYTIEGGLTDLPASQLLQDLERTLSVGLAARIQALRDRGVLQP